MPPQLHDRREPAAVTRPAAGAAARGRQASPPTVEGTQRRGVAACDQCPPAPCSGLQQPGQPLHDGVPARRATTSCSGTTWSAAATATSSAEREEEAAAVWATRITAPAAVGPLLRVTRLLPRACPAQPGVGGCLCGEGGARRTLRRIGTSDFRLAPSPSHPQVPPARTRSASALVPSPPAARAFRSGASHTANCNGPGPGCHRVLIQFPRRPV